MCLRFKTKLQSVGFSKVEFTNKKKNFLFHFDKESKLFPSGMSFYIEKRIEYERKMVGSYKREVMQSAAKKAIVIMEGLNEEVKKTGESSGTNTSH